jgi:hypothetical protein
LKANSLSYLRGITYDLGSPSVLGMHRDQIQVGGIKGSLDSNTQSFPFILQHDALWHGAATAAVGLIPRLTVSTAPEAVKIGPARITGVVLMQIIYRGHNGAHPAVKPVAC